MAFLLCPVAETLPVIYLLDPESSSAYRRAAGSKNFRQRQEGWYVVTRAQRLIAAGFDPGPQDAASFRLKVSNPSPSWSAARFGK